MMGGKGGKGRRGAPLSLLLACDARQKLENSNQQRTVAACRGRGAPPHGVFLILGSYRSICEGVGRWLVKLPIVRKHDYSMFCRS